jgi:hypothetical protein
VNCADAAVVKKIKQYKVVKYFINSVGYEAVILIKAWHI